MISFNGEFDMWDLVEKRSLIDAMEKFIGATPEEVPEKYDELSSIKRVKVDATFMESATPSSLARARRMCGQ